MLRRIAIHVPGNCTDSGRHHPACERGGVVAARKGCAAPTVPDALDDPLRAGSGFWERLGGRGAPTGADAPGNVVR